MLCFFYKKKNLKHAINEMKLLDGLTRERLELRLRNAMISQFPNAMISQFPKLAIEEIGRELKKYHSL